MSKFTFLLMSILLCLGSMAMAQVTIDNFDTSASGGVYQVNIEGALSRIDLSDNGSDFVEGAGSMMVEYVIGSYHEWGSYGNLIYRTEAGTVMDWMISDSLSIWIKVVAGATVPQYMAFRMHIADQPDPDGNLEEYIYENAVIFDAVNDWYNLRIPIYERPQSGTVVPDNTGFILFPTSWGGGTYNNRKLDRDAIKGYNITAVTTGYTAGVYLPADSVTIIYDNFQRFGYRSLPLIIFNGMTVPANLGDASTWGQSAFEIEIGAGAQAGTNAIKWTQGNEWNNGWTGFFWTLAETQNMIGSWMTDSVKFKIKTGATTGALRMQFESGDDGKVGFVFTYYSGS